MAFFHRALLVGALLPCAVAPLAAQGLTDRPARAEDVKTLDGIMAAWYDVVSGPAGEARDWARDSTLYAEGLTFTILDQEKDRVTARSIDHAQYVEGSGGFTEAGFFEWEIHRVVNRFGPMAQVFSTYAWSTTGRDAPEGRGINAIQMYHDGQRWWITDATWMDETPENPIPERYLPPGEDGAGTASRR